MNRKAGRAVPSLPGRGAVRTPRPTVFRRFTVPMHAKNERRLPMNRLLVAASRKSAAGWLLPKTAALCRDAATRDSFERRSRCLANIARNKWRYWTIQRVGNRPQ